jgi:hypothetical protein
MNINLHDSFVTSISLEGSPRATRLIMKVTTESGQRVLCVFNGVVAFSLDEFWEQNVILELKTVEIERAPDEYIAHALSKSTHFVPAEIAKVRERLHGRELKLFRIVPSRGLLGNIVARELIMTVESETGTGA